MNSLNPGSRPRTLIYGATDEEILAASSLIGALEVVAPGDSVSWQEVDLVIAEDGRDVPTGKHLILLPRSSEEVMDDWPSPQRSRQVAKEILPPVSDAPVEFAAAATLPS